MPELSKARAATKEVIAFVIRCLRSGKSPKEIAAMSLHIGVKISHENIRIILFRYPEVHEVYVSTYSLRHPDKIPPSKRIANALREV